MWDRCLQVSDSCICPRPEQPHVELNPWGLFVSENPFKFALARWSLVSGDTLQEMLLTGAVFRVPFIHEREGSSKSTRNISSAILQLARADRFWNL